MKHIFFLLMLSVLFILSSSAILGMKIEVCDKLDLQNNSEIPQLATDFCVTEDGLVIILDTQEGKIKIFKKSEKKLVLINTIGQKGFGPDGLIKPSACFYSQEAEKLVVCDIGLRKIIFYNRVGILDFERDKIEIACWRGAYDLQLKNDRLYVSGYTDDPDNPENGYEFYYVDMKDGLKTKNLLTSPMKYNVTQSEYNKNFVNSISPYGIQGWFDLNDDSAYFMWEGNAQRMLKIDSSTGVTSASTLKTSKESAKRSFSSSDIEEFNSMRQKRDFLQYEKLRAQKTPMVRKLFITKQNNILIIVEGPFKNVGQATFQAQLFRDSELKGAVFIPELQSNSKIFYDKNEGCLWAISGGTILKYRVIE